MRKFVIGVTLMLLSVLQVTCIEDNPSDSSECDEVGNGVCRCSALGNSRIKLTYPNGGETIYSGGRDSLRFCVHDSQLLADSCMNAIRGEISVDRGDTWEDITITGRTSGTTSFAWYVTDKYKSSEALLKVIVDFPCGKASEDFDRSDRPFRIR